MEPKEENSSLCSRCGRKICICLERTLYLYERITFGVLRFGFCESASTLFSILFVSEIYPHCCLCT